jgi:hypothetical protein
MWQRLLRRIVAITVVPIVILGLAGCGNGPSVKHADAPTPTATPSQPNGQPGGSGGGGI